ncbi:MAG: hypothetical protein UMV23_02020 [Halanaerobium sp.]|nr:hypothetical protein [Halanaerobium sp.]
MEKILAVRIYKARIFNVMLFMVFFFGPVFLLNRAREDENLAWAKNLLEIAEGWPLLIPLLRVLALMIVSCLVAVKLYNKCEFD